MSLRGSGRSKLILFGEHAAVYGHPAVGLGLPHRSELRWCEDSPIPMPNEDDRAVLEKLLGWGRKIFPEAIPPGGSWRMRGCVPRAGGFGSSAALCVALARVLLRRPEERYDSSVHAWANRLEVVFHGTPSGIDTGMACDGGLAAWMRTGDGLPSPQRLVPSPWHLAYGALPRMGSTAEAVGIVRAGMKADAKRVTTTLESLGEISHSFIDILGAGNFVDKAAELTRRAQAGLDSLGLSHPHMDEILSMAAAAGAMSGKLSGGGLGGAFFLCAPDAQTRNNLIRELNGRIQKSHISLAEPLRPLNLEE